MATLRRAARGSGMVVQRQGQHIHVAAWNADAFAPNTAELQPPLRALLDEWCDSAGAMPGWRITVIGHALGGGQPEANHRLAQARAAAVQRHLRLRGVPAGAEAAAEPSPAAPGHRGVELLLEDGAP